MPSFASHEGRGEKKTRRVGLGGATGLVTPDPLAGASVAMTSVDNTMHADARFSRWLTFRVFKQYRSISVFEACASSPPQHQGSAPYAAAKRKAVPRLCLCPGDRRVIRSASAGYGNGTDAQSGLGGGDVHSHGPVSSAQEG